MQIQSNKGLTEIISTDHVKHSARSAHNSVDWFFFESNDVFRDTGSTNTGMALGIHVITQSHQNLLNLRQNNSNSYPIIETSNYCILWVRLMVFLFNLNSIILNFPNKILDCK